jgi:DNA-directed RNA polymerase subunit K
MIEFPSDKRLTKYERARIIGARSLQISMGAPMKVKLTPKQLEEINYAPLEIAKMEFEQGLMPISVRRLVDAEKESKGEKEKKKE